jgi:hypothetical protein
MAQRDGATSRGPRKDVDPDVHRSLSLPHGTASHLPFRVRPLLYIATLLSIAAAQPSSAQTMDVERSVREIERLAPNTVTALPRPVAAELTRQGCSTIPQFAYGETSRPNNFVSAHLADTAQIDWAALCSRRGKTSLVIVWGGPKRCPALPRTSDDAAGLTGGGEGLVYARQLTSVPVSELRSRRTRPGNLAASAITHDGLTDATGDYQVAVLYCRSGTWLTYEPEAL